MREAEQSKDYDHATSLCSGISGGLCRRINSQFCTCWLWARSRSWRLCAQSHYLGRTVPADTGLRKPDSGAAPATRAGTHHQRAVVATGAPGTVSASPQSGSLGPGPSPLAGGALDFIPAKAQTWLDRNADAKRSGFHSKTCLWDPFERPTPFAPAAGRGMELAWEDTMVNATEYRAMAAEQHRLAGMCRSPNPASSACAWRKTSSRLRTARNACMERVRRSMRAISRPSDNPRRIGLSLKGVYALKVGYAETHSCPRPGSATVSFAARAIARRP